MVILLITWSFLLFVVTSNTAIPALLTGPYLALDTVTKLKDRILNDRILNNAIKKVCQLTGADRAVRLFAITVNERR